MVLFFNNSLVDVICTDYRKIIVAICPFSLTHENKVSLSLVLRKRGKPQAASMFRHERSELQLSMGKGHSGRNKGYGGQWPLHGL
jgi:hypothetical protein